MSSLASLPDEWQQALALAQADALYVREGLSTKEFAAIAGVHPNTVGKYARQGLTRFQAKFGPHCTFAKVPVPYSTQEQWRLTFVGPIKGSPEEPPVPGALRAKDFAALQQLPLKVLYGYYTRSHAWFRRRFPGWDYMEVPLGVETVRRWYIPIESGGEQADHLPEDNLTARQFGIHKGIEGDYVIACCRRNGKAYFEARYPGWSFREDEGVFRYFRTGPEQPCFNFKQFAEHIGRSRSYVMKQVKNGTFPQSFPEWQVQAFLTPGARHQTVMIRPRSEVESSIALPEVLPDVPGFTDWQLALVQSYADMVQTYTQLEMRQFCKLTGYSTNTVLKVIRLGAAAFQTRFGEGCSFQKVPGIHRSFKYEFRLVGRVHPAALSIPGMRLLTVKDFADEQNVALADLKALMGRGHASVREQFPGWDFWELPHPYKAESVRLFMPIVEFGA